MQGALSDHGPRPCPAWACPRSGHYPLLDLPPIKPPPGTNVKSCGVRARGRALRGHWTEGTARRVYPPSGVATSLPLGRRPGRLGGRVGVPPGLPLPGGFARRGSLRRVKEIPPGRAPRAWVRETVPAGTFPAGPSQGRRPPGPRLERSAGPRPSAPGAPVPWGPPAGVTPVVI